MTRSAYVWIPVLIATTVAVLLGGLLALDWNHNTAGGTDAAPTTWQIVQAVVVYVLINAYVGAFVALMPLMAVWLMWGSAPLAVRTLGFVFASAFLAWAPQCTRDLSFGLFVEFGNIMMATLPATILTIALCVPFLFPPFRQQVFRIETSSTKLQQQPFPWRFSIRQLLLVTAVIALAAAMLRNDDSNLFWNLELLGLWHYGVIALPVVPTCWIMLRPRFSFWRSALVSVVTVLLTGIAMPLVLFLGDLNLKNFHYFVSALGEPPFYWLLSCYAGTAAFVWLVALIVRQMGYRITRRESRPAVAPVASETNPDRDGADKIIVSPRRRRLELSFGGIILAFTIAGCLTAWLTRERDDFDEVAKARASDPPRFTSPSTLDVSGPVYQPISPDVIDSPLPQPPAETPGSVYQLMALDQVAPTPSQTPSETPARTDLQNKPNESASEPAKLPLDEVCPMIPGVALDGFCPVTMHQRKMWVKGNPKFSAGYERRLYYFSDEAAKQAFEADPAAIAPAAVGSDIVLLLDRDQFVAGARAHGVFYGGRMFLFASETTLGLFSKNPGRYASNFLPRPSDEVSERLTTATLVTDAEEIAAAVSAAAEVAFKSSASASPASTPSSTIRSTSLP